MATRQCLRQDSKQATYESTRLLRGGGAGGKQCRQVKDVSRQPLKVVEDSRAQVGALALARLPGQQQTGAMGGGVLVGSTAIHRWGQRSFVTTINKHYF